MPGIGRVRDLVGYLYKAVKTILLYPPTNSLPGEFKKGLHQKLTAFLDECGPVTLTVRGDQLVYEGETVHEEAGGEDNFIATLTRDGIQKLIFLPGVSFEELDRFLGIVKHVINERSEDDDLVTLLWEAALSCIRYEAVNELESVDYSAIEKRLLEREVEMAERAGRIDYSAIVLDESTLAEQATAGIAAGRDDAKSRQLDSVDISQILEQIQDLSDDLSQVDGYLREATQFDPATSTIGIIFEILVSEEEVMAFRETCNIIDNLYDRLIEQADFSSALRIYQGVCELEGAERERSPARSKRLSESRMRTADKLRMAQMVASLNANPGCDIDSCRILLSGMPIECLPHLVSALGDLEHYPPRRMVCDILAERGADRVDTIGNGVFDKRWYVVRNVATILGNIGGARACTYLEKAVHHTDARVRGEVVDALVRLDPALSSVLLRSVLNDPSMELRMIALRTLAQRRDEPTGEHVAQHIGTREFRRLEPTEQKEWLAALAMIQGEASLPQFRKLIGEIAVLDRQNRQRLKGLAVLALGDATVFLAGGASTRDEAELIVAYLEKLSQQKHVDVRDAATRALFRLKHGRTGD